MKIIPQSLSTLNGGIRFLGRGLFMLVLGVIAFYGFDFTMKIIRGDASKTPALVNNDTVPVIPVAGASNSSGQSSLRSGNAWIKQALVSLEQRQSIACEVVQTGWVNDRVIETRGQYQQAGSGPSRQFKFDMQGRLANVPTRMLRVSDGRFLWTDLQWQKLSKSDNDDAWNHQVTRIDLRKLRRDRNDIKEQISPGQASAQLATPGDWGRFGGLPMLLSALEEGFDFSAGRRMQLRGEQVVALVGKWNPVRLAELTGADITKIGQTWPPEHVPHHVVIAVSETNLFPMLIEYRSVNDPLSDYSLEEIQRLVPSKRPLLRINFMNYQFNQPMRSDQFAYRAPPGTDISDKTDHELRLAKERRDWRTALATSNAQPH